LTVIGFRSLRLKRRYGAGDDPLEEFYGPALAIASEYDRAVGYFRGTLLAIAGVALGGFAQRGGSMRLVCSPSLRAEDLNAAVEPERELEGLLQAEIERIVQDPENQPLMKLLAALVSLGHLEIRIAAKPGGHGIYHEKVGILGDRAGNLVSFEGSSNETWAAWDRTANAEGFAVFASWRSEAEQGYIDAHREAFERLWRNEVEGLSVVSLPEAVERSLISLAPQEDIDTVAEEVVRQVDRVSRPNGLPGILMDHQKSVLRSWFDAGRRGIVKHATGAGKTLTALEAIRQWTGERGPALVVVPTVVLQRQWLAEIRKHLGPGPAVLLAGGVAGIPQWQTRLRPFTSASGGPRIVLATMATAATAGFRAKVHHGEHLLLVADEVHGLGAPQMRSVLTVKAGARLGLSATPERYRDAEGTQAIFGYFHRVLKPEFSLRDAIEVGRLVPYDYHVDFVTLDDEEQEEWDSLTERIGAAIGGLGDQVDPFSHEPVKFLLIRRARILKTARHKIRTAAQLVASEFRAGQSWLIYCEDRAQMDDLVAGLRRRGLKCDVYHSALGTETLAARLEHFHRKGGILVAIRCLDEGIDIPGVDHALVLASSQNPRQFIQRRGRVLRKAPGKYSAAVHDLFVLPASRPGSADVYLPMIGAELRRSRLFAADARNLAVAASIDLRLAEMGLEPEDLAAYSEEEELAGPD